MGRFDHLEMGDDLPEGFAESPENGGIIDQHFYLEKAEKAFNDENYERALSYYSRALQYDVNIEEAWFGQLRCLIGMNELQESIIWSDRALERFPQSGVLLAARAVADSRLGRMQSAMAFADSAIANSGNTPYVWTARGEVLISSNATNARACFTKALELATQDWTVRMCIAKSYIYRGHYHEALEQLRIAVRLAPESFICWYWLGKCAESLGDLQEAQMAYRRSMSAQPNFTSARKALEGLHDKGPISRIASGLIQLFKKK